MQERVDRVEQFKAEIADMPLSSSRPAREKWMLVGSGVGMVMGIFIAVSGYASSLDVEATPGSNVDLLNASSYTDLAIVGLVITVASAAVFLRCSIVRFLRFWLLRQIFEQRVALDAALERAETQDRATS